jgi:hypothetical protein
MLIFVVSSRFLAEFCDRMGLDCVLGWSCSYFAGIVEWYFGTAALLFICRLWGHDGIIK